MFTLLEIIGFHLYVSKYSIRGTVSKTTSHRIKTYALWNLIFVSYTLYIIQGRLHFTKCTAQRETVMYKYFLDNIKAISLKTTLLAESMMALKFLLLLLVNGLALLPKVKSNFWLSIAGL